MRGVGDAEYRGQAVLAGDDAAVGEEAALIHDHAGGRDEVGGPGRVSKGRYQDLAGMDVCFVIGLHDNPRLAGHHAR